MTEQLRPERSTSRVLLVDPDGAVLLFQQYGKSHDVPPRWITTGGGVDPGEDWATAARREVEEETGLVVADAGEPFRIDHFDVDTRWHPYRVGHWAWFAIAVDRFAPADAGWMPDEQQDIVASGWFTADALEAQDGEYEPLDLPDLIREAMRLVR